MPSVAEQLRANFEAFLDALERDDEDALLESARAFYSSWFEAWWSRDPAATSAFAEDHELHNRSQFTDWSHVYTGKDGLWRHLDDIEVNTQASSFNTEEVHRAGDRVGLLGTVHVTARHTRLEFDFPWAVIWTVRERKIVRSEMFTDHAAALAALDIPSDASERS